MQYKSFEDLPVWNTAIELAVRTFVMTGTGGLGRYSGLRNQLERAAVSVSNNIAEGFERGTKGDLLTFLYYSLSSAGEVRSMLLLIERLPGSQGLHPYLVDLLPMTRSTSRQLSAWIETIKNSTKPGPRHRNDATRRASKGKERADAFLLHLERIKRQGNLPPGPGAALDPGLDPTP